MASTALAEKSETLPEKIASLEKYQRENYQELIYIQTDKRFYLTGERINFKVFCLEKTSLNPSKLSKVAYFEVLNEDNSQLLKAKIELHNGTGYGQVFIPTNINSGNYVLRGYTRWMRNFGPDTFFHTMVSIINPFKKAGLKPQPVVDEISMDFFAESGELINGVKTKIVFEAKDIDGYPIDFTGKLMANDTIKVADFEPVVNGVGSFEFTPDIFNKYHVEVEQADGSTTTHSFLPTVGKGFSFQANNRNSSIELELFCNDPSIVAPSETLYYILQQNGKIRGKNHLKLMNGRASRIVDAEAIQEGIFTISIFSAEGKFLRQRHLVKDINRENKIHQIDNVKYEQREKVSVDLSEITDKYEGAELSVSVASVHENFAGQKLNLPDYLMLKNFMKGYIHGFEWIFDGTDQEVVSTINNLLIAHPHHEIQWQQWDSNDIQYVPEYRTPLISGMIKNKETNEPVRGIYVYLSIPDKHFRFDATRSGANGSLLFEMDNFYGSNELVVQTDYTKDTIYSIVMDDPFSHEFAEVSLPAFRIDESMENWIKSQSQHMQVRNAYRRYQPKLPVINKVDSSTFYHDPDSRYYLDDYTRFIVMEEVMREYISGVNVRKNRAGFHFMVLDLDRNDIFHENPLMILDGVPVFDADEIIALDPLKIKKIETIKARFHNGYLDCRGIVSFTTYDGDLTGYNLHKRALVVGYDGLQPMIQYYFPQYASSIEKRSTTPDFRNVLYWNPRINVEENTTTTLEFYTSDETGNYEVTITGISDNGKAFSVSTLIEIRPAMNN